MSKMVMVALWFLVGLFLLIGGITSMMTLYITGVSLIIAGILTIILAIGTGNEKETGKWRPRPNNPIFQKSRHAPLLVHLLKKVPGNAPEPCPCQNRFPHKGTLGI